MRPFRFGLLMEHCTDPTAVKEMELGLGAGFLREEFERTGLTFHSDKVRVDRLAESVEVFDGLPRGDPLTFHGQHYSFENFANFPPPVQRPRPPILIAGTGPRVLSIAANTRTR